MKEHYGITDLSRLACDPWSVHVADPEAYAPLRWRETELAARGVSNGKALAPPRLVQTWLYLRDDADDNHYAHPLPVLPVVDLNARKVIAMQVLLVCV